MVLLVGLINAVSGEQNRAASFASLPFLAFLWGYRARNFSLALSAATRLVRSSGLSARLTGPNHAQSVANVMVGIWFFGHMIL